MTNNADTVKLCTLAHSSYRRRIQTGTQLIQTVKLCTLAHSSDKIIIQTGTRLIQTH